MTDMSKFYEAMAMVNSLPKDLQSRFISEVKNQQRQEVFNELNVGTIVKINHKKISPMDQFRVTKINHKNVKCQKLNSNDGSPLPAVYTVSMSLLEVIS